MSEKNFKCVTNGFDKELVTNIDGDDFEEAIEIVKDVTITLNNEKMYENFKPVKIDDLYFIRRQLRDAIDRNLKKKDFDKDTLNNLLLAQYTVNQNF